MTDGTAEISVYCNPPHMYGGPVHFILGLNDEKIAEGTSGETMHAEVPLGRQKLLILIENGSISSFTGTTEVEIHDGMELKIKYGVLSRSAKLVLKKRGKTRRSDLAAADRPMEQPHP